MSTKGNVAANTSVVSQSAQAWEALEKEHRAKSSMLTAAIILLLFIASLIFGLFSPFPPPAPTGLLIDFGTTTTGLGESEPQTSAQSQPQPVQQQQSSQQTQPSPEQTIEESVALPEEPEEETEPEREPEPEPEETAPEPVEPEPEPEPVIDENLLFNPNQANQFENGSSSQGDSRPGGNMGDPVGGQSDNYVGSSTGGGDFGIGEGLNGWGFVDMRTDQDHQVSGKILVRVELDDDGNVLSASFVRRNSTIVDRALINKYVRYVQETARFTPTSSNRQNVGVIEINLTIQ